MFISLFKVFFKNIVPLNEEEYSLNSKKFNPIKSLTVVILVASLVFNIVILYKLTKFQKVLKAECPSLTFGDNDGDSDDIIPLPQKNK